MHSIILASSSFTRKQLLSRILSDFTCISPDISEEKHASEPPHAYVRRLAQEKALKIVQDHPNAFVLGSDQTLVIEDKIYGKPLTHGTAKTWLNHFSEKKGMFLTGIALHTPTTCIHDVIETHVHFSKLNEQKIETYLHKEKPYHCAGGIMAETSGISLFKTIDAQDPSAIHGLPLIWVTQAFENMGINIPT